VAALLNNILLARFFWGEKYSLQLGSPLNCERGTGPIFWPKPSATSGFQKKGVKISRFLQNLTCGTPDFPKKPDFLGSPSEKTRFFHLATPHWGEGSETPSPPPNWGVPPQLGVSGTPKLGVATPHWGTPKLGSATPPIGGWSATPPKGRAANKVVGGWLAAAAPPPTASPSWGVGRPPTPLNREESPSSVGALPPKP